MLCHRAEEKTLRKVLFAAFCCDGGLAACAEKKGKHSLKEQLRFRTPSVLDSSTAHGCKVGLIKHARLAANDHRGNSLPSCSHRESIKGFSHRFPNATDAVLSVSHRRHQIRGRPRSLAASPRTSYSSDGHNASWVTPPHCSTLTPGSHPGQEPSEHL